MATTTRILDANVNGTVYTTNANSALEALDTCHSGAVAPTDEVANGKLWLDTSTTPGILKIYNNATWEVVHSGTVDINGGTIDGATINGTVIGGTAPSAITGTTLTATGAFTSLGIDDNAAATAMTIDASGNVGIGNAVPSAELHVTAATGSEVKIGTSSTSAVLSDFFGGVAFESADTNGTPPHYSGVKAVAGDTFGNANLEFYSGRDRYEAGTSPNMIILGNTASNDGNVGIGTATPVEKLVVSDTTGATIRIESTKDGTWTDGESFGALEFYGSDTSGTGPGVRAGIEAVSAGTFGLASSLLFKYNNGGGPALEAMRIDASGNVLVGKTVDDLTTEGVRIRANAIDTSRSSAAALNVARRTTDGNAVVFYRDGVGVGTITVTASATSYNTSSDYRLKENITSIQGAADIVKAMRPCTYTFKADGSWHDGFLAHELQELHPRAVTGEKDAMKDEEYEVTPAVYEDVVIPAVEAVAEVPAVYDDEGVLVSEMVPAVEAQPERIEQRLVSEAVMGTRSVPDYQGVDYSKLTPILTAALQEALNKIDALEARVAALEL